MVRQIYEYVEARCQLSDPILIFKGIYDLTNGKPCDGCGYKSGCTAIKKFSKEIISTATTVIKNSKNPPLMSNAQLAAEFGISKRQVSKLRIPGTNDIQGIPVDKRTGEIVQTAKTILN